MSKFGFAFVSKIDIQAWKEDSGSFKKFFNWFQDVYDPQSAVAF